MPRRKAVFWIFAKKRGQTTRHPGGEARVSDCCTPAREKIYCAKPLSRPAGHAHIVDAGKEVHASACRLRDPPAAADKGVLAALHAARCEVEDGRADLNGGVDSRRMREGTHERVRLGRAGRYGLASRIGVEGCRAMLRDREKQPVSLRIVLRRDDSDRS